MADHRHNIPMPAHLGTQNAKAVLRIVVGDALDKTRQNLPARRFRLRPHVGVISVDRERLIVLALPSAYDSAPSSKATTSHESLMCSTSDIAEVANQRKPTKAPVAITQPGLRSRPTAL